MSNRINIEEIINTYIGPLSVRSEVLHKTYKAAIKEIVEAAIDKCAEESKVKTKYHGIGGPASIAIDKESILQVKKLIDYD